MRKFRASFFAVVLLLLALAACHCYADSAKPAVDNLPRADAIVIQCVRDRNCLLIPVELNGRTSLMLFDTGADNITMSRYQLAQFALNLACDSNHGSIQGIGAGNIETLKMAVNVKVGTLSKPDFPLNIQPQSGLHPILGFNFFKNYLVNVDQRIATITLRNELTAASDSAKGERSLATVKVSRSGNQFVLPVELNGKAIPMLFDTGADGITLNRQQAASAKLEIPRDVVGEVHQGVGGTVSGVGFTVPEIIMGPIVKRNVKISVVESPGMPYPLMGSDFFKDCSYTIDEAHSQITFERI